MTKLSLLEVSELEQSLACTSNQQQDLKLLLEILSKTTIQESLKIRLSMLYALRYEKMVNNQLPLVMESLINSGISQEKMDSVLKVVGLAGSEQRMDDIYGEDVLTRTKQMFKPIQGIL